VWALSTQYHFASLHVEIARCLLVFSNLGAVFYLGAAAQLSNYVDSIGTLMVNDHIAGNSSIHHVSESSAPPPQRTVEAVYRNGQLILLEALALPNGMLIVLQFAMHVSNVPTQNSGEQWQLVPRLETQTVEAVCENGSIRLLTPVDLPEETAIQLSTIWQLAMVATPRLGLQSSPVPNVSPPIVLNSDVPFSKPANQNGTVPLTASSAQEDRPLRRVVKRVRATTVAAPRVDWKAAKSKIALPIASKGLLALFTRLDLLVLGCVMFIYGWVRYIGLVRFPIFFFSDEAIQTNLGLDFFRNGLRDEKGVFLPPFFRNVEKWTLSLSVYIQGMSALLFGNSIFVNRATAATVTLLAGIAVALTLRLIFRLRLWWIGPLALAALPVWFLHSRTSFETTMMVSFYACFLCTYLVYRYYDPRYLIAAIVFGAATFYSYTNGQGVMLVSSVLLLISDLRYHMRTLREQPRLLRTTLITTVLVAAQYIRFRILYPDALAEHLRVMNSTWSKNVPLSTKLSEFAQNYLLGLSPSFWFSPNNGVDLERHTFKGWGNFPLIFAPLLLLGLWICLRQWRSSAHRAVLIAILAAPFSASLANIHNYRVLEMVIPVTILVCLGIERTATWLTHRQVPFSTVAIVCAIWLVGTNIVMLRTSLSEGPTWYTNYGMYGSQYGASQVFGTVAELLETSPDTDVVVSPDWANNGGAFVRFFLTEQQRNRVRLISPDQYLTWKRELKSSTVFVLPPFQYDQVRTSGKLNVDTPLRVLPYPDGNLGFYFVHMRYVDNIDEIFAAERAERNKLITDTTTLDGQTVRVTHSLSDAGSVADLFDDDKLTLLRAFEANPMVIEIEFPTPRDIREIGLDFYRIDLALTIKVWADEKDEPKTFTTNFKNLPESPHVNYTLPNSPIGVRRLRLELLDLNSTDIAKIHVQGIQLR
jgi:hypothetical protein